MANKDCKIGVANLETALGMLNNIKEQSKQLTDIKQFYDEFKYFKTLNFEINGLINNIKKDPNITNNYWFWKEVFTGIFASFIYSVMIALIIFLGRNELGNFINNLFKT